MWPAPEIHNKRGRRTVQFKHFFSKTKENTQQRSVVGENENSGVSKRLNEASEGVRDVVSVKTNNWPSGKADGHMWGRGAKVGKSLIMLAQAELYNLQSTAQVLQLG